MLLLFDIGGTNFRYYIYDDYEDNLIDIYCVNNVKDVIRLFKNCISFVNIFNEIDYILVSFAGIIHDSKIYGCNNIEIKDNDLVRYYGNIPINYINDGDVFLMGEIKYNLVNKKYNILGLYFGTGIGCGLIINNKQIYNSEIHRDIEIFMKNNKLTDNNLDEVSKFLGKELSKLIELLNLDYIIINGYVNKFKMFSDKLINNIDCNEYYNPEFIFSGCNNPIIYGLLEFKKFILTNG
jgi:hypothetical protein